MSVAAVIGILISGIALILITLHFLLIIFSPVPAATHPSETKYTTIPSSEQCSLSSINEPHEIELSVVIPAYNEDERLGIMVDEVMEYLLQTSTGNIGNYKSGDDGVSSRLSELLSGGVELLVVDDGSRDGTTKTSQELSAKWSKEMESRGVEGNVEIRVITLQRNRGKGGAVQHGVIHSRGRLILFADADGASRFSDLDLLLEAMDTLIDEEGHGMVVGSRAHLVNSDAVVKRSALRNLLMHGFHFFLKTLGVDGIRDTQCGFKLFTRQTARLLFPPLHLPRWSFDVELLLLASLIKPPIPVLEIPIAWHEVNGSKIRLGWDSLGMARDLLVLRGNLLVGRWGVPSRYRKGEVVDGNGVHTDSNKK